MSSTATVDVPHLGGSRIGYRSGRPHDPSLPTVVMVNSFTTTVDLYRPQFEDTALSGAANLLALEPYGHGATRSAYPHFTYWDSALANLQAMDALGVDRAFVLGTSQGGWVAARMALLAPDRIQGILPLGTSMDFESPASRERGCWDGIEFCTPSVDALAAPVGDDWVVPEEFVDAVLGAGLGEGIGDEFRAFWRRTYRETYTGDDGRHRLRVCTVNLRDRDGLHGRLDEVRCPVLWLHGTDDTVYSVANAEDGIRRFTGARHAELEIVQGGQHFLSASNPEEVDAAALAFVTRWA
ncbi:alpha/beta hydrolase [Pseudonocardia sp. TMWB2A]|uniref:alpha/beta fold hydrolase n=1 Tax=Pseudonocardia sp. TMWB2A TaxID=687430 RepID=UPI00307D1B91